MVEIPPYDVISDWEKHGLCTYRDPRLWDGKLAKRGRYSVYEFTEAKKICDQCPVRNICLDRALAAGDVHVMRGGKTPDELRALVRARKARKLEAAA